MLQYEINVTDEHKEIMFRMAIIQKERFSKVKVHNGHEIYMMNIEDGVISKAPATITTEHSTKNNKPYKVIHLEQDLRYLYLPALNLKNAHKKFENMIIYVDAQVGLNRNIKAQSELAASLSLKGVTDTNTDKPINNP